MSSQTNRLIHTAGVAIASLALSLLALASPATANTPSHRHDPALDITGFNHACGTAIDSQGDVYVSSAGESKIRVFDPSHVELTAITNTHEPCSLTVDSTGHLYASEQSTGTVVRYTPNSYPLSGSPTYEPAEPIDSSGTARGISIDPVDGRLYVAEGSSISVFNPDGTFGAINEKQRVLIFEATGGTYTLTFKGQESSAISWNANHTELQAALEALPDINAGDISVTEGNAGFGGLDHIISFEGALAGTDSELLKADTSGLTGGGSSKLIVEELVTGFSGHIGESSLSKATGVAAYTYRTGSGKTDRYVFAVDASTDQVKIFGGSDLTNLKLRREINGPKAGEDFDFPLTGAFLAVDPGNGNTEGKCSSVAEQACTAGHLVVYDSAHSAVDEFDATGEFIDQISHPDFSDAAPTALAIDRSGDASDGTIYLTAGAGANSKLLAFAPLASPSHSALSKLSQSLDSAQAVATDPAGNVYVASGSLVHIYNSDGKEIKVGPEGKGIPTLESAVDLAVDSSCNVYVLVNRNSGNRATEKVQYYSPTSCPPQGSTQYSGPTTVATGNSCLNPGSPLSSIGINPASNHVFVVNAAPCIELGSAAEGSPVLNPCFGCSLGINGEDIAGYGASGNVYISEQLGKVFVVDPTGTEVLARIDGNGSPKGQLGNSPGNLAVDQRNGHVLLFNNTRGVAEEYDGAGAFVSEFGEFTKNITRISGIAIDNSGGPSDGTVYVAFDDTKPNSPDLWAFGSLAYGEPPLALSGIATEISAGNASLRGTVNPHGFDLTECKFEYLTDVQYKSNGNTFAGAVSTGCAETQVQIGHGTGAVSVHADLSGLDPDGRYRFRLVAANKYGSSIGGASLFGPPIVSTMPALPVLFNEAILRAEIDPSGLATTYHFDYGTDGGYGQSTPPLELKPSDGAIAIHVPLTGLTEETEYHFRIVVENEAKTIAGPDQTLATLTRGSENDCPNVGFRTGLSANLSECRAYELVTPAETRGAVPRALSSTDPGRDFSEWLTIPRGEGAGERLAYRSTTLPNFDGTGQIDAYGAQRAPGEGPHPARGWITSAYGPSYAQAGGSGTGMHGVSLDQSYWLLDLFSPESAAGAFPKGTYLRTPAGFEPVGQGGLGSDPNAGSRFVSPGGSHLIFTSKLHLENDAPPTGTQAIYDRAASASHAQVISIKPDGTPFSAGADATYIGATENGASVVFQVGGVLYLHREDQTTEIAEAPNSFAGISEDGRRVFYIDKAFVSHPPPADLFICDVDAGPCAGPGSHAPIEIASGSIFVNVSQDGGRALIVSESVLAAGEENENGETAQQGKQNLFAWEDTGISFVAALEPQDLSGFNEGSEIEGNPANLRDWTAAIGAGPTVGRGGAASRSTPDGAVFVFQSHAQLTPYDNEGHGEIYRYEPDAPPGEQIICVSCDPTGSPPSGDALLQVNASGIVRRITLIPNITDDGMTIFFQSRDRLMPEDANDALDVYEWKASASNGCNRPGGCLSLISSGQGEEPSYLYSMTADGHDVFFETSEKLVGADVEGSPSLYDARAGGGIPDPAVKEPCSGDACKSGQNSTPVLHVAGDETNSIRRSKQRPCPKRKHRVKGRCIARHGTRADHHGRHSNHRAHHGRRAAK